ncbi:MAG: C-GCAxxG-C-C family protein [Candidatus Bathyarchaeota archaeon]|nr:C-GCAxxG-C-C family protein [Candidatus Bathyarchaeota archaeon]
MTETENVSRRDFVKMAGAAIGGVALGAVGGYSLIPPKETIVTNEVEVEVEVPQEVPEHPWTYVKLDVDAVKARAYDAYFNGGCCYGVYEGVIGELKETVGFPYTTIPTKISVFGKGGIMGWGATCGVLTGAGMAINVVTTDLAPVNEIMGWYTEEALPIYTPVVALKVEGDIPTSVSGSPLCHASVTNWSNLTGFAENAPERAERCARLVADTAGKVAEMLNDQHDGTFTAAFAVPDSVIECGACHGADGPVNNVFGKMDCETCHGDAHN